MTTTNTNLKLYYMEACPFCKRVLNAIDRLKISHIQLLETSLHEEHAQHLKKVTGRQTVPCLFIDEQPMFESLDIIAWLDKHYGN